MARVVERAFTSLSAVRKTRSVGPLWKTPSTPWGLMLPTFRILLGPPTDA